MYTGCRCVVQVYFTGTHTHNLCNNNNVHPYHGYVFLNYNYNSMCGTSTRYLLPNNPGYIDYIFFFGTGVYTYLPIYNILLQVYYPYSSIHKLGVRYGCTLVFSCSLSSFLAYFLASFLASSHVWGDVILLLRLKSHHCSANRSIHATACSCSPAGRRRVVKRHDKQRQLMFNFVNDHYGCWCWCRRWCQCWCHGRWHCWYRCCWHGPRRLSRCSIEIVILAAGRVVVRHPTYRQTVRLTSSTSSTSSSTRHRGHLCRTFLTGRHRRRTRLLFVHKTLSGMCRQPTFVRQHSKH